MELQQIRDLVLNDKPNLLKIKKALGNMVQNPIECLTLCDSKSLSNWIQLLYNLDEKEFENIYLKDLGLLGKDILNSKVKLNLKKISLTRAAKEYDTGKTLYVSPIKEKYTIDRGDVFKFGRREKKYVRFDKKNNIVYIDAEFETVLKNYSYFFLDIMKQIDLDIYMEE